MYLSSPVDINIALKGCHSKCDILYPWASIESSSNFPDSESKICIFLSKSPIANFLESGDAL